MIISELDGRPYVEQPEGTRSGTRQTTTGNRLGDEQECCSGEIVN